MKLLRIICRIERVEAIVAALREAGAPRLYVTRVHALGSGVDPEHYRFEDGGPYTAKAKIEVACRAGDVAALVQVACEHARTGHRGDGVVIVSDVDDVIKIRTGDVHFAALL